MHVFAGEELDEIVEWAVPKIVRESIARQLATVVVGLAFFFSPAFADVVVDHSPDTTGVPVVISNFSNIFPNDYKGDRFTLSCDTTITGGAIFSNTIAGAVDDPVRFVILPDEEGVPGAEPVVDVTTQLDAVDNELATSQSNINRKHAVIPAHNLRAGSYWFYMAGDGVQIQQSTGNYDDGMFYWGSDEHHDLERGSDDRGDTFFILEGQLVQELIYTDGFETPLFQMSNVE